MAIACSNCGYAYNDDQANQCLVCGQDLRINRGSHSDHENSFLQNQNSTASLGQSTFRQPNILHEQSPIQERSQPDLQQSDGLERNILRGRINHLERYDERSSHDAFEIISKVLIFILFFLPYSILFIITGILSFAFAIIGFSGLCQLFNPINWTAAILRIFEIIVLRQIRGTLDTIPTYRGMVEDNLGREYAFRLMGPLNYGNLVVGHNVTFTGNWREGTFIVREGVDATANSAITSRYKNPWKIIFFVVLGFYIFLGLFGYYHLPELSSSLQPFLR